MNCFAQEKADESNIVPCPRCKGQGKFIEPVPGPGLGRRYRCPQCKGAGRLVKEVYYKPFREDMNDAK